MKAGAASTRPRVDDRVYGVVLAGGRSSRMGRDKALLPLGGRTLLDRTCDRLAGQCRGLVISRHTPGIDGLLPNIPVVADHDAERAGPLGGLLAALDWIARTDPAAGHAVSVSVDTPFLPPDLVERMLDARNASGAQVVCAASGDRRHPIVALWPVSIRADLRSTLVDPDARRVGAFVDRHQSAIACWAVDPVDPFFNVNTPEDAAEAEALMRRLHLA